MQFKEWLIEEGWLHNLATAAAVGGFAGAANPSVVDKFSANDKPSVRASDDKPVFRGMEAKKAEETPDFASAPNKRAIEITLSVPSGTGKGREMMDVKIGKAIQSLRNQLHDAIDPEFIRKGGFVRIQGITDENNKPYNKKTSLLPLAKNGSHTVKYTIHIIYGVRDGDKTLPARPQDALRK